MLGIDIVKISRIKNVDSLKRGILSINEIKLFDKAIKKKEFLAGRFAAKEAFLKANHKGLDGIPLKEIEVLYRKDNSPFIKYKNKNFDVSISHDGDYAIAITNI